MSEILQEKMSALFKQRMQLISRRMHVETQLRLSNTPDTTRTGLKSELSALITQLEESRQIENEMNVDKSAPHTIYGYPSYRKVKDDESQFLHWDIDDSDGDVDGCHGQKIFSSNPEFIGGRDSRTRNAHECLQRFNESASEKQKMKQELQSHVEAGPATSSRYHHVRPNASSRYNNAGQNSSSRYHNAGQNASSRYYHARQNDYVVPI